MDIYSGKIISWDEVAHAQDSGKIYVANRELGDSSRRILEEKVPGFKEITNFAGKIIFSTPQMVEIIKTYRQTISYLPLAMATNESHLRVLKVKASILPPKMCRMEGIL